MAGKRRIIYRDMTATLPVVLVISLAVLIVPPYLYNRHSLSAMEDKAENVAAIAGYSLLPAVQFEDRGAVQEVFESLRRDKEIIYILVEDSQGTRLGDYATDLKAVPSGEKRLVNGLVLGKKVWNMAHEMAFQGKVVGRLIIGFSLARVHDDLKQIRFICTVASALLLVIGTGLALLLSLSLTRPLRRIIEAARLVGAGDLSARADVVSDDEVGELAETFNAMVGELSTAMRGLDEARETLEKRVEERTAELQNEISERKRTEERFRESEVLFRTMVDYMGEGVALVDAEGRFLFANKAIEEIFNSREADLVGRSISEFTTPETFAVVEGQLTRRRRGERTVYDLEIVRKDGTNRSLMINGTPQYDEKRVFLHSLVVMTDITERKKSEGILAGTKRELEKLVVELGKNQMEMSALVALGDDLQIAPDEDKTMEMTQRFCRSIFREASGAVYIRKGRADILERAWSWGAEPPRAEFFAPDDCWAVRKSILHVVEDPATGLVCPHAVEPAEAMQGYICVPFGLRGGATGILQIKSGAIALDKARQRTAVSFAQRLAMALDNIRLVASLREQSVRDQLTGLYNRRYLEATLERDFSQAEREKHPLAVMMFDIDHFKIFNDTYGHDAGDAVLQAVSKVLMTSIRKGDAACRYGGEEFTIIMPGSGLGPAAVRAGQLLERIRHIDIRHGAAELAGITVSIGVAAYPETGVSGLDILQAADSALLDAKRRGRDRFVVWEPGKGQS